MPDGYKMASNSFLGYTVLYVKKIWLHNQQSMLVEFGCGGRKCPVYKIPTRKCQMFPTFECPNSVSVCILEYVPRCRDRSTGNQQTPADISNLIEIDELSTQKSMILSFRLLGRPSFVY